MDTAITRVKIAQRRSTYDITVGASLLDGVGGWAAKCLSGKPGKALIVSNRRVFSLYGDAVSAGLSSAGFRTAVHLIGDGEKHKSIATLEKTLSVLGENEFSRTDVIVALGGGVVGDLAGFAASIYLRGIAFLQIPTSLLAMIDSSVGGKTGINTAFGKNLTGSFYQPAGVLIDVELLSTLPLRELTAGFCEVIKQSAISSKALFKQTSDFLSGHSPAAFREKIGDAAVAGELVRLVNAQVGFKAKIVQNDERESTDNTSSSSRKILNFGHTLAHALEKVTNYSYLKHGEAVGYGVLFAASLSKKLEFISQDEVDLLNDVVHRAGILPTISHIDPSEVFQAFKHDKKQIGNSLHWVLLRGIGKPVVVAGSEIPRSAITSTLKSFFQE